MPAETTAKVNNQDNDVPGAQHIFFSCAQHHHRAC